MVKYLSLYILLLISFVSCDYFRPAQDEAAVARVNETYLYEADILKILPENYTKADSTILVNDYINRWATRQLLVQGAELNLEESTQEEFDRLVEQYKSDLYSKTYLEALVYKSLDTLVSLEEASAYYEENKEAFKLNEELIKFRYINVDENRPDLEDITMKFKRYSAQDKHELDSIAIQFKSYSLKDSVWIRLGQAVNKIPVITAENKNELLKKSNFIQRKDSLGLYLMQINEVLLRNETAPLEYVKPTIDQIVINKRKLELIRQLEKDITTDAIKNKQFETYN
ncbi:peptidyl-prolyl cis-trans isomerase [Lacinutrix neustonica]|uniref:Peptidyl-prolyl cis-trans isomerase n=1 Tax=Lacinutrix neustonica TaxID=2980107 RepID=A0A9E8SDE0_9FLAO|nr:peptidyl-prolyl cis-trans isomerase [Lacinutrix neustonica]WAC02001.1 peptidyl-prolyl cis-trans isomerase [Lacinutrix neustonica]